MRKLILLPFILLLSSCALVLNFQDLPSPGGNYIIGTDIFDWEDTYRDEWFTPNEIDSRKISVQIWYPAIEKSDSLYPYLDYPELRIEAIAEQIDQSKNFVKPVSKIKGNSYYKAKPMNKKFPLVLFSHGFGGYKTQNLIAVEALVSKGYIVISADHTHDAIITIFKNGTVVDHNYDILDNVPIEKFWEIRIPQVNTRAADISFMIDKLQLMKNHPLYNSINFNKIGVFGMSTGGATSVIASWNDTRISACLNLDGWFVPIIDDIINTGIKIPFCYIGQKEWENAPLNYEKLDKFYKNCISDSYLLKINNTKHSDYSDSPHFSKIGRMLTSGKDVDDKFAERIGLSVVGFFDEYLKDINYNWTEVIVNNYETSIQFK